MTMIVMQWVADQKKSINFDQSCLNRH